MSFKQKFPSFDGAILSDKEVMEDIVANMEQVETEEHWVSTVFIEKRCLDKAVVKKAINKYKKIKGLSRLEFCKRLLEELGLEEPKRRKTKKEEDGAL